MLEESAIQRISCLKIEHLYALKQHANLCSLPWIKQKFAEIGRLSVHQKVYDTEFDSHLPYQPTHKISNIDWKVTARLGIPHIKTSPKEQNQKLFFLLDMNANMFFTSKKFCKSTIAMQIFTIIGWYAVNHGMQVGIMLVLGKHIVQISAKTGSYAFEQLLQKIIFYYQKGCRFDNLKSINYEKIITKFINFIEVGSHTVLISDFVKCQLDFFNQLKNLPNTLAIRIFDPMEVGVLPSGNFSVSDGQHSVAINRETKTGQSFILACQQHFNDIATCFTDKKIPLINLHTKTSIIKQLMENSHE